MYNNTTLPFPAHIFCIVVYFTTVVINAQFILDHILVDSISFKELHRIEFAQIFGCIIAIIAMLLFNRLYNSSMIITYSSYLYWLCILNITIIGIFHKTILWHFLTAFFSTTIVLILVLSCITHDKKSSLLNVAHMYFSSALLIFPFLVIIKHFTTEASKLVMILNLLSIWLLKKNTRYYNFQQDDKSINKYRFSDILPYIKTETLIGFVTFYVIVVKLGGYEIYMQNSLLFDADYIVMIGIAIFSLLIMFFLLTKQNYNKHQTIIYCIIIMILLTTSTPYFEYYKLLVITNKIIFFTLLQIIFLNTIFILIEKFESKNLHTGLLYFSLSCILGYYCGYITIQNLPRSFGAKGFLISIALMLTGVLLQYLSKVKKLKRLL